MDGPADGSRKRMTKLVSRDDDMDLMRIVGRVLSGKFCMDSEEEDVENFEIGANKSVADTNTCPDASQGPTPADPTGNASDKDPDAVNLGCGGEGSGLNGKVDLITPKPLPSGELEIEKGNDVKADVSNGERYDVKGTGIDKDLDKVDLGCGGEGSGLNGKTDRFTDESVPDDGLKIEVNDVNTDVLAVERYEENRITEREGEYHVGDLVWGKVRSHPWWPGQIFDPSAASDKALRYCEREHLIAYFGDQSFAWNDGSKIKPFRKYFAEMEKQSNGEGFSNAVACALEEVSRRTEFGLSCPCLPQEVHSKIQSQVMANAGIREESSTREGGDNLSTAASFSPGGVVQFLESLAEAPHLNPDRLQFLVTKAQLLAFNRWRGHSQLPVLELGSGLLEDDTQITVVEDEMDSRIVMEEQLPGPDGGSEVPSRKRKSATRGLSQKRKCLSRDVGLPDIKGKQVLDSPRSEKEAINRRGRKKLYSGEKQEPTSAIASASEVKRRKTMLPPESSNDEALQTLEGSDGTMAIIPAEMPTPDEILSKLSFAARNPMQGYKSINPFLGMLRGFRNSVCAEKAGGLSQMDHAVKHKGKQISNMETPRIFESEGIEDSYWTDRIIQSDPQDQALFESGKPRKSRGELETGVGLVLDKYGNDSIVDKGKESLPAPTNEISEEETPTALILNFSDLDSIPSIIHLNEIFTHNGPLKESETAILSKSKRAKVIFKRRADAETAFSSLGKYVMFGPSLVSYRLHYAPTPRKARGTKGGKNKRTDP